MLFKEEKTGLFTDLYELTMAQGYFFSRPCDAARIGELLRQQQIAFTLELA